MSKLLTEKETQLCQSGFMHMVDNGYGKISTLDDVLKLIGAHAEFCRREEIIGKMSRVPYDPESAASRNAVIKLAELIEMRLSDDSRRA